MGLLSGRVVANGSIWVPESRLVPRVATVRDASGGFKIRFPRKCRFESGLGYHGLFSIR